MSKEQDALKLALEALDSLLSQYYADTTTRDDLEKAEKAITAIREALAEQQEPVGVIEQAIEALDSTESPPGSEAWEREKVAMLALEKLAEHPAQQQIPRAARGDWGAKRKSQPAQQEPLKACVTGQCPCKSECDSAQCCLYTSPQPAQQQCRTDGRCQYAIDSGAEGMGHCPKGKCVMPVQQQEPAAWVETREDGSIYWGCETDTVISDDPSWLERPVPVYFAPPPRKPLTDEQIEDLYFDKFSMSELKAFARAIEAAHGIKGDA